MKTKKLRTNVLLSLLIVLISFTSCRDIQKLVDQGRYDEAMAKAVKKLSRQKKKNPKYVIGLERAFEKLTSRDMAAINQLSKENKGSNWARVYDLTQQIERRQNLVSPLLPLYDKNGYQANFQFIRTESIAQEAKTKAAKYHYHRAEELMALAEAGDKQAARNAHYELEKIDFYFRNYKAKDRMKKRAKDLGLTRVFFAIKNSAPVLMPLGLERELLDVSVRDINEEWNVYYTKADPAINFDYNIVLDIRDIDVSPDRIREEVYTDAKDIIDGWEYVLDNNGNVAKDSLGNDITQDRVVRVYADVIRVFQDKAAHINGSLEFIDNDTKELIRSESFSVDAHFDHEAARFNGDRRALSSRSLNFIGNEPVRFPADDELVLQAADELKIIVKNKIQHSQFASAL